MTADATFWDKIADKYAASPVKNIAAYEETLTRTRAYLDPADNVLELGCGTGTTALKLAGDAGHITATDISPRMIAIAQDKILQAGAGNVTARVATAADIGMPGAGYDAVLGFNYLHLLPDMEGTIAQIHGLLRPGGHFISKTVCLGRAPHFKVLIWVMQKLGKAPFVRCLKVETLEAVIRRQGFEIVETGNYPARPVSRFIVARKV
ncbi:MAG: methyltransferase domain-containing protein [Roseovarius sp.]|jgi:ubiquinone/menaquinone biosynthesis C-methylase UbiE|uniref:class I SAM-dependent methyltransferase n=1 Tax=Roseovarius sp. TaxID=1486281 RepID=UPI0032EB4C7B